MKRILVILLALLTLLPLIASCSDGANRPAQTTPGGTTAPTATEDPFDLNLPDLDFEERTFTICSPGPWGNTYFDSEELTSDTVNDSLYYRNREVEGLFNITIRAINNGYTDN